MYQQLLGQGHPGMRVAFVLLLGVRPRLQSKWWQEMSRSKNGARTVCDGEGSFLVGQQVLSEVVRTWEFFA
jgi:hypothetical protein